ncbi:hypothetical protein CTheo_8726 [Ceratobasidium theobromae]|uniref:C2 domain-containing protein n=1 Tax=Ceratobasidium theobromae TaxID=1582974 RepID=A0A5N5Q7V1_9AGAM|nr:hypothetical protein CTheo_8726 [Ceratobasidium theobromae]
MSISSKSAKLYDVEITFHSAHSLPVSDIPLLSSDPYILASVLVPSYSTQEPGPPPLLFRTRTIHKSRDPQWESEVWRVGGVPGAGFMLRVSMRDEDAGKKDDSLGEARVSFFGHKKDGAFQAEDDWGLVREGLYVERRQAPIKKRRGGARTFMTTYAAAALSRSISRHGGNVVISVKVLDYYSLHFSPLLGRVTGTKSTNASNLRRAALTDFQANKLQLTGPVPNELKFHYVGYRPFIESMSGIKGRLLNHALSKQHKHIYSHNQATVYGCIERHQTASNATSSDSKQPNPDPDQSNINALAAQFLHMTQHGAGHRLYTYVITLDGQLRFTETGDEFAIEMLSKHSLHANVARYIAYSGEFFIRRIGTHGWEDDPVKLHNTHANNPDSEKHNKHETRPTKALQEAAHHPPSKYELVIDNDSGTYRPNKDLLPVLAEFLGNEANLGGPGGLGKITAMDGFDEGLDETKKRRAEAKKKRMSKSGRDQERPMVQLKRGSSLSSRQVEAAGLGRRSMSSGDVRNVIEARKGSGNGSTRDQEDENEDRDAQEQGNGEIPNPEHNVPRGGKTTLQEVEELIQQVRTAPVQVLPTN